MSKVSSGLAAVLAAATSLTPPTASVADASIASHTYTVADLQAAFPDLCATIRTEGVTAGATAERARLSGIDAIAIAGHEALVAEMKGDSSVSVEAAGLRLLKAEQAVKGGHLQAIKDVETATSAVKPAPLGGQDKPAADAPGTPDTWKAEHASSAALQGEFASSADYVAFKTAESSGRIKVLGGKK